MIYSLWPHLFVHTSYTPVAQLWHTHTAIWGFNTHTRSSSSMGTPVWHSCYTGFIFWCCTGVWAQLCHTSVKFTCVLVTFSFQFCFSCLIFLYQGKQEYPASGTILQEGSYKVILYTVTPGHWTVIFVSFLQLKDKQCSDPCKCYTSCNSSSLMKAKCTI